MTTTVTTSATGPAPATSNPQALADLGDHERLPADSDA